MVLVLPFWAQPPNSKNSTFAIFGIQYVELTDEKISYFTRLTSLLRDNAAHIEYHLQPMDPTTGLDYHTIVIVTYWFESSIHKAWWNGLAVQSFWNENVPSNGDAGVWREVLQVSPGRFMHATGNSIRVGFAAASAFQNLEYSSTNTVAERKKYWGIYRERLPDWSDDPFQSEYSVSTSETTGQNKTIKLHDPNIKQKNPIRQERVYLPRGIDNLLWVHEYQDYTGADEFEHNLWREKIADHISSWIDHLNTKRRENGVLSFRNTRILAPIGEGTTVNPESQKGGQFMYFVDMAHFEASGKAFRDHRLGRSRMEHLYRAGGSLGDGRGKIKLMVELAVLKADDFEAEYIGCREGTGLMSYEAYIK
ncbi:heme-containing dehydratase protein [Xylogone sp. PMI_703]|nr:heme-containing dehydratase protein [Xylogone sp. PMI_703]